MFNGVANQFYTTKLPFRDDCLSHETYPEPIELPLGRDAAVAELLPRPAGRARTGPLDPGARARPGRRRSTARGAAGGRGRCARGRKVPAVRGRLPELPGAGPARDRQRRSRKIRRWPAGRSPALGVPPYDIVRVDGREGRGFFLLAGDRDAAGVLRRCDGLEAGVEPGRDRLRRGRVPRAGAAAPARPRPPLGLPGVRGARARTTCRSSSTARRPTRSSGTPCATRRSSSAASCSARSASTTRPASRSSGSPSRSRPSTTRTPRRASPTLTTRGRRSPASATGCYPDLDIVGWYHTHPDFGIFLSSHDLFIHRHFFAQPLQVAYVVDPIRQTRGFFQWRDGGDRPGGRLLPHGRPGRPARPGAAGQRPGKHPQHRKAEAEPVSPRWRRS